MALATSSKEHSEYEKCAYPGCSKTAVKKHWVKPIYMCEEHYNLFLFVMKIIEDTSVSADTPVP